MVTLGNGKKGLIFFARVAPREGGGGEEEGEKIENGFLNFFFLGGGCECRGSSGGFGLISFFFALGGLSGFDYFSFVSSPSFHLASTVLQSNPQKWGIFLLNQVSRLSKQNCTTSAVPFKRDFPPYPFSN